MIQDALFTYQSQNTRIALRLYCDVINNSNADLFIVMARKAVCLIKYLLKHGMIREDLSSKFISSTALLYDKACLKGKHIAIIDDIIISGSALASTANLLLSAGVNEQDLEIIALVRDSDYQAMKFTRDSDGKSILKCAMNAKDAECIEISYDISHLIVHNGMQYDADYPAFLPVDVSDDDISNLMNSIDWDCYETTNVIQQDGRISAFSLFPKKRTLQRFWNAIGINLEAFIHIKVRLYFCNYPSGKCKVNIVPMACINEISEEELNHLFNLLHNSQNLSDNNAWSNNAKLHFLQYYIAYLIKKHLIPKGLANKLVLSDFDWMSNFGQTHSTFLRKYLEEGSPFSGNANITKNIIPFSLLGYDKTIVYSIFHNKENDLNASVTTILLDPIKWWYLSKELPARKLLCEKPLHFLNDYEIIEDCLKRLKYGFSLRALMGLVEQQANSIPTRHEVSVFLDRAIDEGIIVPVDFYNESQQYYCRAYRHGEDLPFAEADKCRLLFFLKELDRCFRHDNNNQPEYIAETTFEKMIVLFYQIGLKKGRMFNRFLGFGDDPILQQRFNVHGVVAAVNESLQHNINHHVYLSSEADNDGKTTTMITRQLVDPPNNFIRRKSESNQYFFYIDNEAVSKYLSDSKLNNISEEIKDDISLIANIIEKWYWLQCQDGSGKKLFKEDISALTSCSDIFSFASSIATEIHYFKRYWEEEATKLLADARQGHVIDTFSSSRFSQALPSGRDKHEWYENSRAQSVIKCVPSIFEEAKLYNENLFWKSLWKSQLTTEIRGTGSLQEYTDRALQFLYLYSEIYEWLCAGNIYSNTCEESERKYQDQYDKLLAPSDSNYYYILKNTERKSKLSERIDYLVENINMVISCSEQVVNKIEICLSEKVGVYSIDYNSGFVVELYSTQQEYTDQLFRDVWDSILETGGKTLINIVDLGETVTGNRQYGVFHTEKCDSSYQDLVNIYKIVHHLCCKSALKSKTVFMPVFPPMMVFRHNLRSNIKRYVADFLKEYTKASASIVQQENNHLVSVLFHDDVSMDIIRKITMELQSIGYKNPRTVSAIYREMNIQYFQYSCGEMYSKDKVINSSVKILVNGTHVGTGFLISYQGVLYCASSQHLLDKKQHIESITAIAAANEFDFSLTPLNRKDNPDDEKRPAKEDVIVFSVDLSSCPDFDSRCIFSEKDCVDEEISDSASTNYTLFGFGEHSSVAGRRTLNISTEGHVARGFVQMTCSDGKVERGYSGAAVVTEGSSLLYGIHAQSTSLDQSQNLLICPIRILLSELDMITNRR